MRSWLSRIGWLLPRIAVPLVALALADCASVVPSDDQFAEMRCKTVLDDGVEGLPAYEIGAILAIHTPTGEADFDIAYDMNAMRLALKELNNGHDVNGHHFRVRVCDTRAHWSTGGGKVTRDLATWLIEEKGVKAIISDASADTATLTAVTLKKGVVVMAISSTAEDLTYLADDDLVWRVAPSDVYQAAVLGKIISDAHGNDAKIAVLQVDTPYGNGLVDALHRNLGDRVHAFPFGTDGAGLQTAVQSAADLGAPALLIVGTSPQVAQIVNARKDIPALAGAALYLADGACDTDLAKQSFEPGASVQSVCTRPGQPPNDAYKAFQQRFKTRFGDDPAQSSYTQHSYDVVYCLALAHAWATGSAGLGAVTGKALAEGLKHLSAGESYRFGTGDISKMIGSLAQGTDVDVDGASGPLDFNPKTGEAPSGYESFTVDAKGQLTHAKYYAVRDQGDGIVVLPADVTGT